MEDRSRDAVRALRANWFKRDDRAFVSDTRTQEGMANFTADTPYDQAGLAGVRVTDPRAEVNGAVWA